VAWVEEARNVSKRSLDILIPTIRKPGSEIWISFNPELDTDEVYVRFVKKADDDMAVIDMSFRDNPWFPEVLEKERLRMERADPDGYLTVWEGRCRQYIDGAIYAAEIRDATTNNRITRVPYEPTRPVHTFWDLGYSDSTAIWLVQAVGMEYRVIKYIEAHSQPLDWYVRELKGLPYLWGADYLPHDARAKSLQTGKSTEETLRTMGRDVRIVPQLSVVDGINAARTIFGRCWFDEEGTREGMNRLRRYAYEIDENGQRSKLPLHDENSHGADAFRYFAVGFDNFGEHRAANDSGGLPIEFVRRKGIA
jgi:phage terminase large subunit